MYNIKTQSLIFEGYRKGKQGKIPANNKLYKYEEVSSDGCYGAQCKDNIIDVSFDNWLLSDKILDILEATNITTYAINSTKGVHTYWKLPDRFKDTKLKADVILACGVKADIHGKGTYIPLKVDGKEREETYEGDIKDIPELPVFLYPTHSKEDLWQLKEGEGRNEALSRHVFALKNYEEEMIKNVFTIINKYILADKLDDSELSVILRPETIEKVQASSVFDDNGKFKHRLMAELLHDKNKIVDYSGMIYMYDFNKNLYVSPIKNFHSKMIDIYPDIKDSQRVEVYKYLEYTSPSVEQSHKRYISFRNGIYDIETDKLLPHSPDYFITNQIPWNYNCNVKCKSIDNMLDKVTCNDKELRMLLEEMIGYCMYRSVPYKKFFVLTGGKDNGKSTFIFALNYMLGEENIASQDIPNLEREYNMATIKDKLANVKDDITDGYFDGKCASMIKQIVGGNRVSARNPYGMPFDFEPYATLVFSANAIPRIKDTDEFALTEKMVPIPFNAHITKDDPDYNPNIIDEIETEDAMEYMIQLGIQGLHRVIDNRAFTISKLVEETNDAYKKDNNPVLQFIDEDLTNGNTIENENVKDVYTRYLSFYSGNNVLGSTKFNKQICAALGLVTKRSTVRDIYGKIPTMFVKKEEIES